MLEFRVKNLSFESDMDKIINAARKLIKEQGSIRIGRPKSSYLLDAESFDRGLKEVIEDCILGLWDPFAPRTGIIIRMRPESKPDGTDLTCNTETVVVGFNPT